MIQKLICGVCASFLLVSANLSAETINFGPPLMEGDIVSMVSGDGGSGPITVFGENSFFPAQNTAMIYATSDCTPSGNDADLGTPNENFDFLPCLNIPTIGDPADGPGEGAGGASPVPPDGVSNSVPLGNALIVSEDLDDDDPNDLGINLDGVLTLDFSTILGGVGVVTLIEITIIDTDLGQGAQVQLLGPGDFPIGGPIPLQDTDDNGVAVVDLGPTAGVAKMVVSLFGSGAIDNIVFNQPEDFPTRTIGYWKNHPTVINGECDDCEGASLLPITFCDEVIMDECRAVELLRSRGKGANFTKQAVGALLNCEFFGCPPEIPQLIDENCNNGNGAAGTALDIYNQSGDNLPFPDDFTSPSALPDFCS